MLGVCILNSKCKAICKLVSWAYSAAASKCGLVKSLCPAGEGEKCLLKFKRLHK